MAIKVTGRTRNPKKGMVTEKRAEFREEGDRARARRMTEQAEIQRILNESGGTISDADRMRVAERYMKRNDGGIAKKTRTF